MAESDEQLKQNTEKTQLQTKRPEQLTKLGDLKYCPKGELLKGHLPGFLFSEEPRKIMKD